MSIRTKEHPSTLQRHRMTQETLFTLIGYLGTVCISTAYLVALTGRVSSNPAWFLWLNLVGAISLCFPSYLAGTLVAHVLNGFWIIIALSAMLDHYTKGVCSVSERSLISIAVISGLLVLILGTEAILSLTLLPSILLAASMVSLLCFMGSFFYISLNPTEPKSISFYLMICMTGNMLYMPILIQDGNWPIFWLQAFCFGVGAVKLTSSYLSFQPKPSVVD